MYGIHTLCILFEQLFRGIRVCVCVYVQPCEWCLNSLLCELLNNVSNVTSLKK